MKEEHNANSKRKEESANQEKQGKAASTQAGEFVRSEVRKLKRGKGNAKSRQQAVAIGLSEARRSGVKLKAQPRSQRQAASKKSKSSSTRGRSSRGGSRK